MKHFTYNTKGVCSRCIDFDLDKEHNTVRNVKFTGGCPGNTLGVSVLIENMDIDDAISRISGIKCGYKPTSCPDQLAIALEAAKKEL